MELYIKDRDDINYKSELIPPAFLRKQEGGINSPKPLTLCVKGGLINSRKPSTLCVKGALI
jgi:hypothetical protein